MDEKRFSQPHFELAWVALILAAALAAPSKAAPPPLRSSRRARLFELRDAIADERPSSRRYVSMALRSLADGDAVDAVELSARALKLDRNDEAALATLRLAESELAPQASAQPPVRDAVAARLALQEPAAPARWPAPLPEAPGWRTRGFWRIVFSPIIGLVLLAAALCHIFLGKTRLAELTRRSLRRAASPEPPSLPRDYRYVATLGEGGMGVVYEAEDRRLGRRVAIKRMRDEIKRDAREREHFLQEARVVAGLHHPTIVDIHTIVEEADNVYLVFEFIEGKTVEKLLEERRLLPLEEAKSVLRGVCDALEFAHRHGVVHRDLKPSNIMVTPEGAVKVMDFGVARRAKDSLVRFTMTQTIAGTPLYMAPEAEDGVVRKESDVYALGACLYEMVTGEHPFSAPNARSAKMRLRYIPPSRQRDGIPAALDVLVDWALQPDPERRLSTPREFGSRLEEIV